MARLAGGAGADWEATCIGVPDMVIQRILRHANVSTSATYHIKTAADDVKHAMEKLEHHIPESSQTVRETIRTLESQEQPTLQTMR